MKICGKAATRNRKGLGMGSVKIGSVEIAYQRILETAHQSIGLNAN